MFVSRKCGDEKTISVLVSRIFSYVYFQCSAHVCNPHKICSRTIYVEPASVKAYTCNTTEHHTAQRIYIESRMKKWRNVLSQTQSIKLPCVGMRTDSEKKNVFQFEFCSLKCLWRRCACLCFVHEFTFVCLLLSL